MNVEIVQENNEDLNRLIQDYELEFSVITNKKRNSDGFFDLDVNLNSTDNYLLLENDLPIGFCIKGLNNGIHEIFEFYIIPSMRRSNRGQNFAIQIFEEYSGEWQVKQISGADKATLFWRKTIANFTSTTFKEALTEDPYWGKVIMQSFTSS